jgi:RND family efflux transporter MFP subunit
MKRTILRATFILTMSLVIAGCGRRDDPESQRPVTPVRAQRVRTAVLTSRVEGSGSVQSAHTAELASKIMGTVLEIRKRAGDPVRSGEVIVVLDARDVAGQIAQSEGALAQARAAAVLAETNLKRYETLLARGSASQLEADQARFQYETAHGAVAQAEGALATARSYQSYTQIAAPFSGRVVDRLCEVGDLAAPGRPLLRVEDASRPRLHVLLDSEKAGVAIRGAAVDVQVPSLGGRLRRGTVAEVVPAADPATRSTLVKIDLDAEPGLRSGMYARALFPSGTRRAIVVPTATLRTRGGLTGVFVVENGKAAFRLVTVATAAADTLEVLSGLSEDDAVILTPSPTLESDTPVEVQG